MPPNPLPVSPTQPVGETNGVGTPWWAGETSNVPQPVIKSTRKRTIIIVLVTTLVLGMLLMTAARNPGREPQVLGSGSVINPPSLNALAAGCSGVIDRTPAPADEVGWIPPETLYSPATVPPVNGNFAKTFNTSSPTILNKNFLTMAESVSLLYRGWVILWYRDGGSESLVKAAEAYVGSLPLESRVMLARWNPQEVSTWGTGHVWMFVSWDTAQMCRGFSNSNAAEFVKASAAKPAPGMNVPLTEPGPKAKRVR